jgi:hypothetical protein
MSWMKKETVYENHPSTSCVIELCDTWNTKKMQKNWACGANQTNNRWEWRKDLELPITKIRLFNVLIGKAIRPELHNRARTLNKDEMTEGLKKGHDFWLKVSNEYNSNNPLYSEIAQKHPGISGPLHPSKYSPINLEKAKITTNLLLNEYEDMVEVVVKSIITFTNSIVLVYMHGHV